jgi:dipeptidyl aminopeptidase/acylaminoacyl peptidase
MRSLPVLASVAASFAPVVPGAAAPAKVTGSIAAVRVAPTPPFTGLPTLKTDGRVVRQRPLPARGGSGLVLSPDGRHVAYVVYLGQRPTPSGGDTEGSDIWVARADGSHPRRLTRTGDAANPVWSPDGGRIAFTRTTDRIVHATSSGGTSLPVTSVWRVAASGGSPAELPVHAPAGRSDATAAWTRAGLTLTRCGPTTVGPDPTGRGHGASFVDVLCDVIRVQADGSGVTTLATLAQEPAWSPNGRFLAFTSGRDHTGTVRAGQDEDTWSRDIYVKDMATGSQRRITDTPTSSEIGPGWSADGMRLLFIRRGPDPDHVAQINADGTCRRRVTHEPNAAYVTAQWLPAARPGRLYCGAR